MKIVFRCDGSGGIGLGHVMRCIALAESLGGEFGWEPVFAIRLGQSGLEAVRARNFNILDISRLGEADYGQAFGDLLVHEGASLLFLDAPGDLAPEDVRELKSRNILVADIDDASDQRVEAGLVFYPPVPQVAGLEWNGFSGQRFQGWDCIPLRSMFAEPAEAPDNELPEVLVAMGGADPAFMIEKALRSLAMVEASFTTVMVCGPAFKRMDDAHAVAREMSGEVRFLENVRDMAGVMSRADLAVASFGVTAYELAAVGVPSIYLSLTDDHALSASAFHAAGIAVSLGRHDRVTEEDLGVAVREMLLNHDKLRIMRKRANALGVGRGTERIVDEIKRAVDARPS